jgi:hypothetical protein
MPTADRSHSFKVSSARREKFRQLVRTFASRRGLYYREEHGDASVAQIIGPSGTRSNSIVVPTEAKSDQVDALVVEDSCRPVPQAVAQIWRDLLTFLNSNGLR